MSRCPFGRKFQPQKLRVSRPSILEFKLSPLEAEGLDDWIDWIDWIIRSVDMVKHIHFFGDALPNMDDC